MSERTDFFMSDAQLQAEVMKCEYCAEKPCKTACPADCSPADFLMAVRCGEKADFKRAAALIMANNPLGGICGSTCPDKHCMSACSRKNFDRAVNIPKAQASIIQKARDLDAMPEFRVQAKNGKKVAIVGAGPAGLAAAATLGQLGYEVTVFEAKKKAGGMCWLIPDWRLDKNVLKEDLAFVKDLGDIEIKLGEIVGNPEDLRANHDAVIVAGGLNTPVRLGIRGEEVAISSLDYLENPKAYTLKGKRVAVIGGGAIAADCAETAKMMGAESAEIFALETLSEMPLTEKEFQGLLDAGVQVNGRVRVTAIQKTGKKVVGLNTIKIDLQKGKPFHPRNMKDLRGTEQSRKDIGFVILAIGNRPAFDKAIANSKKGIFLAGDMDNGPTTVVEAVAAGKNTAAQVNAFLTKSPKPSIKVKTKSPLILAGRKLTPVSLETDFFGRPIISPFLLSAAPPSDGYEQMKKAYQAGWAGGIMKTAFDHVPIHIPSQYMFQITPTTYGNCDNVSGHPLNRVCKEIEMLRTEFPDRLTIGSTGGPVTGDDESDKKGWQANTLKLESAGAMAIEYSLSCPQGGDGTKGDIVSQDAELTAKIIDWVMEVSNPEVPKLFKLTAAVTAIYPIIAAIKEVFAKYPNKKAGVTLANTFPTLSFRKGSKPEWEEGIVVGMSGEGVTPISNLTLANVSKLGVVVSGNGGPMDYKSAAHFLALGARTVQFCTIAMKHGYGIIDELHAGLSHLMQERGIRSVRDLIGRALPNPITGFMELTPKKKISDVTKELCQHCGNCTRCPYLAITLDKKGIPHTDPSKCIGCSICAQKCFAGALFMRDRTQQEAIALTEE